LVNGSTAASWLLQGKLSGGLLHTCILVSVVDM
jgi:hypothetical protein